ncbi:MAG: lysophospholipid acyltransferase family protein [Muribaculaceae bacterium]|nr:lysophospholipid acyltransferase family protein [Muribaculaceae bacterium]
MTLADLKYHSIIFALKCVALFPLRALYLLSDFACFILHKVVKYRVGVVRKNLRNSFPDKSEKELRTIENKFYRHLCDVFIESIKLLHISDRQLMKRVEMRNLEALTDEVSSHQAVILFLGHYGNWEWVPALTLHADPSLLLGELYKPLHNKVMDRVMHRIRSRFSSVAIPTRTAYRTLLQYKREGQHFIIGFIADQRPVGQPLHHWVPFMGQLAPYMAGGETIGDRIGAAYVYAEMIRKKRGHYILQFTRMKASDDDKQPYPYTRLFYSMLEKSIRRDPTVWLWSHNRWHDTPPEGFRSIQLPEKKNESETNQTRDTQN